MKVLEFDGLQNARDISYGDIKEGRLIRSEALTNLSEADVQKLQDLNLKAIIDLRTPMEAKQADVEIPGATYYSLPLLGASALGVTREEGSFEEILKMMQGAQEVRAEQAGQGIPDMRDTYRTIVSEDAKEPWTKIFDLFADNEEGAILWHCTAGKDRCGLVSAAIEHCLGISDEQIMDDYLLTNEHPVIPPQLAAIGQILPEDQQVALKDLFIAKEDYLNAALDAINENYGGFDGFLEQVCGVDAEKKARIRANYLK